MRKMLSPAQFFNGSATNANFGPFGTKKHGGAPVSPDAPKTTMVGRLLASESRTSLESRGWNVDEMIASIKGTGA